MKGLDSLTISKYLKSTFKTVIKDFNFLNYILFFMNYFGPILVCAISIKLWAFLTKRKTLMRIVHTIKYSFLYYQMRFYSKF
jgi:hypothetical protein